MDTDRLAEVEKSLAVHLAECAGKHKVIAEKLEGLDKKIDGHIEGTIAYREKTLHAQVQTRNILLYGFIGIASAIFLGPDHAIKLLSTLLKGG